MNELQAALKIALANTFVSYFKAHSYHWNVEGIDFSQYHSFFGDFYEDMHSAVDELAERIRTLDAYAPISLQDLIGASTLEEDKQKPSNVNEMISNLLDMSTKTVESLNKVFDIAQEQNNQGLMNLIADRLDKHSKHNWMLKASLKNGD